GAIASRRACLVRWTKPRYRRDGPALDFRYPVAGQEAAAMDSLFDLNTYSHDLESIRAWIVANALTLGVSGFAQIAVVGLAFLAARFAAVRAHPFLESVAKGWRYEQQLRRIASALDPLTLPIIWLTLQWLSVLIAAQAGLPYQLVKIVVSLITAW